MGKKKRQKADRGLIDEPMRVEGPGMSALGVSVPRYACGDPNCDACRGLPQEGDELGLLTLHQKRAKNALDGVCEILVRNVGIKSEAVLGALVELVAEVIGRQDDPEQALGILVTQVVTATTGSEQAKAKRGHERRLRLQPAAGNA